MKRLAAVTISLLSLTLSACGAGKEGGAARTVKVKGRVPAMAPQMAGALAAPITLADATKVIVVSQDNVAVSSVTGGTFEFDAETGRPAGVILAGPGDAYLGFIAVRGTIPTLPLQAVDESVVQLDLGTLAANGTVLEPGIDPIGHGITLSDAEIAALSEIGFVARMILARPDVDGDGAIDYLQGRQYSPQVAFARNSTIPTLAGEPTSAITDWSFGLNVVEEGVTSYPPYATITGPVGSGIGPVDALAGLGPYGNAGYHLQQMVQGSGPPVGTWTVAYRDRTLTFEVPDMSGLAAAAPTLLPTVTLNADLTINKITWVWRFADGSTSTAPAAIADRVNVQVNGNPAAPRCQSSGQTLQNDQLYSSTMLPVSALEHTLTCQNIPWNEVRSVQLLFIDVFNNNHFVVYKRP